MVQSVAADGPAALAGLKVGDRLTKLGMTLPATTDDLRAAMRGLKPGDAVAVDVVRDGQMLTVSVKVGSPPGKK